MYADDTKKNNILLLLYLTSSWSPV